MRPKKIGVGTFLLVSILCYLLFVAVGLISVLCGAIFVFLQDGVWLYSYESVWRVLKGAGAYAMAAVVYLVIKTIQGIWKARQQNKHGG